MALAEWPITAGKATTLVAMLKRAPECRRDRPRSGTDLRHPSIRVVPHDHPARIARLTLRRFRGNVGAVFKH